MRKQTAMAKPLSGFSQYTISLKTLSRICIAIFIVMMIPLLVVAFFNYPADDDFAYTVHASVAWLKTHSFLAVFKAIINRTIHQYMNAFGLFVHPIFNGLNTLIFGVEYYFLNNWYMMAIVCLSVGYLLKGVLCKVLFVGKSAFWIVYTAVMILLLQFMPSIGEGVYWHAGSNHTFSAMMLLVLLGILSRCHAEQSRMRAMWRAVCIVLCCACVGAVEYSTLLGGSVLLVLLTLWAHCSKSKAKRFCWLSVGALAVVIVIFAVAPGNAKRQAVVGTPLSPVYAIVVSILDSFDYAGQWTSPQLLAMMMLIVPTLWKPLKNSSFRFAHPFWAFVTAYGLFSAAFVPGVYTGYGYQAGRYMNVLYVYFLVMAVSSIIYFEGSLIRLLEKNKEKYGCQEAEVVRTIGERFSVLYLVLCIFFLALGGFANTIMNTSSLYAVKMLATGEAEQFYQGMKEREEYIRVTEAEEAKINSLPVQPYIFKVDRLYYQKSLAPLRYMKYYFESHYKADQQAQLIDNQTNE